MLLVTEHTEMAMTVCLQLYKQVVHETVETLAEGGHGGLHHLWMESLGYWGLLWDIIHPHVLSPSSGTHIASP